MMLHYFVWPVVIIVAWLLAWHFWFAPLLAKIKKTMGVTDATLTQRFEGSKTIIVSFLLSMFATLKALLDGLAGDTSVLDDMKTNVPWATYMSSDTALKIVSAIPIVIVFLHLYGKLKAALTPPQA